ncbi:MAG: cyclomaltodextrinase C-terminal domain-containing protein, partial [Hyphomicrobiales bacterium]|nr:cyclomaltodextrinase C-terminal domain-containing protein [Hyphomicrobiales bacterium]
FRRNDGQSVLVLANFSELPQTIAARRLRTLGLKKTVTDVINGGIIVATGQLELEPYQLAVLLAAE